MKSSGADNTMLPDGTVFRSWEVKPKYSRTYHVAQKAKNAADSNPGTIKAPWRTIGKAAQVLRAGERVIVHEGVYREWVQPERGGAGPNRLIAYQAAPGEEVVLKGSDLWSPEWELAADFKYDPAQPVYCARLSPKMFSGANVFCLQNYPIQPDSNTWKALPSYELRRGQLFLDGQPLKQVSSYASLASTENAFWVGENGMTIYLRLASDEAPAGKRFEITTREQVFAPQRRGLSYIRVSGFKIFHAGNGIPIPPPQRGALSATAGHHWIVEDCEIGHANTIGMDLGCQWWGDYRRPDCQGFHLVRRNHVHHCGVAGVCAWHNRANESLLVEDNLIADNGSLPIQDHFETGGIKMHYVVNSLIRRNVFLRNRNCAALWLDGINTNTRITQNLIANTAGSAFGACFVEITHGPVLVDNNIIVNSDAKGVYEHDAARLLVVQNLVANGTDTAVRLWRGEATRLLGGTHPEDDHRVWGNVLAGFHSYILAANASTRSDCNVLAGLRDPATIPAATEPAGDGRLTNHRFGLDARKPFGVCGEFPQTPEEWRQAGNDVNSVCLPLEVFFDAERLELRVKGPAGAIWPEFVSPKKLLGTVLPLDTKRAEGLALPTGHQPGTRLAPLAKLLQADLLGRRRKSRRLAAGPLLDLPLDGSPICVDPRRGIISVIE